MDQCKKEELLEMVQHARGWVAADEVLSSDRKYRNYRFGKQDAKNKLSDEKTDLFLTGIMLNMGYKITKNDYYTINDYGELCEFLNGTALNSQCERKFIDI